MGLVIFPVIKEWAMFVGMGSCTTSRPSDLTSPTIKIKSLYIFGSCIDCEYVVSLSKSTERPSSPLFNEKQPDVGVPSGLMKEGFKKRHLLNNRSSGLIITLSKLKKLNKR